MPDSKKPAFERDGHNKYSLENITSQRSFSQQNYRGCGEKALGTAYQKRRHISKDGYAHSSTKYAILNERLLKDVHSYLPSWLPAGRYSNHEYVALNPTRLDRHLGSFCINTRTGKWKDFATDDKGGDIISLYAYLKGIKQSEALAELLRMS